MSWAGQLYLYCKVLDQYSDLQQLRDCCDLGLPNHFMKPLPVCSGVKEHEWFIANVFLLAPGDRKLCAIVFKVWYIWSNERAFLGKNQKRIKLCVVCLTVALNATWLCPSSCFLCACALMFSVSSFPFECWCKQIWLLLVWTMKHVAELQALLVCSRLGTLFFRMTLKWLYVLLLSLRQNDAIYHALPWLAAHIIVELRSLWVVC